MPEFEKGFVLDDSYKILSLIAMGGMSNVYKAERLNDGQVVAIKVPFKEIENNHGSIQRFHHGCQISMSINHPNILKIFPIKHKVSRLYSVMEYMEGRTLKDFLKTFGKVSEPKAVKIIMRVCDILDYIHRRGILHQDIKSDNIFLLDSNDIKLIDFGLAYCPNMPDIPWSNLLSVGGTPDYLAPERINGVNDKRSDIYSLGVTLYEIVTGSLPFLGRDVKEIINAHLTMRPLSPREVNPFISKKLERVILKSLEKDPVNRYQSVLEFKSDLERCFKKDIFDKINWVFIVVTVLFIILLVILFFLTKSIFFFETGH